MPRTTNEKIDIIKKKLLREAENSDRESDNMILEDELESVIADIAGRDKRTVKKYKEYIESDDDVIRLNDEKLSLQYRSDIDSDIQAIIESSGVRSMRTSMERSVVDMANNLGIDINDAVKTTLIHSVGAIGDIVETRDISKEEEKYITRLIVYGLYPRDVDDRSIGNVVRGRGDMYKSVFGVETIGPNEENHIEQLRREAFDVAATLNIASEPPPI